MKKYFMSGTDDEVKFGDIIDLDFTKELEDKKVHKRINCEFIPELVPLFLEEGVVEEKECEDDEDAPIDFEWDNSIAEALTDLIDINKQLIQKVASLEDEIKKLKAAVTTIAKNGKKAA